MGFELDIDGAVLMVFTLGEQLMVLCNVKRIAVAINTRQLSFLNRGGDIRRRVRLAAL